MSLCFQLKIKIKILLTAMAVIRKDAMERGKQRKTCLEIDTKELNDKPPNQSSFHVWKMVPITLVLSALGMLWV